MPQPIINFLFQRIRLGLFLIVLLVEDPMGVEFEEGREKKEKGPDIFFQHDFFLY
jgi:hypothetical protein